MRRRLRGDNRGSFPLQGSNWFTLPQKLTKDQWREFLALLDEQHQALRETVATARTAMLCAGTSRNDAPAPYVHGSAMHDTYHAGQIRMIKTLYKRARSTATRR